MAEPDWGEDAEPDWEAPDWWVGAGDEEPVEDEAAANDTDEQPSESVGTVCGSADDGAVASSSQVTSPGDDSSARLLVPAIHYELPPHLRLPLDSDAAWLDPLDERPGIALRPAEAPACAAGWEDWADPDKPSFRATVTREHGKSLSDFDVAGYAVGRGPDGRSGTPCPIDRVKAVPVSAAVAQLGLEGDEARDLAARLTRVYPTGNVAGHVHERWMDIELEARADGGSTSLETCWARFTTAVALDGQVLGAKHRRKCRKVVLAVEMREVTSGAVRSYARSLHCRSHRCPTCAQFIASRWRARIGAQASRDAAAGRVPYILLTLTIPRKRGRAALAFKLLSKPWTRFLERVRRRWGPLAFVRAVEAHQNN